MHIHTAHWLVIECAVQSLTSTIPGVAVIMHCAIAGRSSG